MSEKNTFENIPPIIKDWVEKMHSNSLSHVKLNYYSQLKNVAEYVQQELKKYDNESIRNQSFGKMKGKK